MRRHIVRKPSRHSRVQEILTPQERRRSNGSSVLGALEAARAEEARMTGVSEWMGVTTSMVFVAGVLVVSSIVAFCVCLCSIVHQPATSPASPLPPFPFQIKLAILRSAVLPRNLSISKKCISAAEIIGETLVT